MVELKIGEKKRTDGASMLRRDKRESTLWTLEGEKVKSEFRLI